MIFAQFFGILINYMYCCGESNGSQL